MSDENKRQDDQTRELTDTVSGGRREALGRLGRYALYTAPALLVLFDTEKAAAANSTLD